MVRMWRHATNTCGWYRLLKVPNISWEFISLVPRQSLASGSGTITRARKTLTVGLDTSLHMTFNRWCMVVSGTWKYDDPRLKMSHEGASHKRLCVMCFVVWPTTNLKLYIVFWDSGETRVSIVCHLKMHTVLITVRGLLYVLITVLIFTAKSHRLIDLNCI